MLLGILLCLVWVAFSLLLIENDEECSRESEKLDKWVDKYVFKINKGYDD